MMPLGYWMGISHPPKSTISAPAATWTSYSWVRFSSLIRFSSLKIVSFWQQKKDTKPLFTALCPR